MKILKTQTLYGPNFWSINHPHLIVIQLDVEDLSDRLSNQIPDFYNQLVKTLPGLIEHHGSRGYRGGFLQQMQEGISIAQVIQHVALELQILAQMPVSFGRTRPSATPEIYRVAFEYENPRAGRYAARAALRLCQSLIDQSSYPQVELEIDLEDLQEIKAEDALGPTTEAIVNQAQKRGIPWQELPVRHVVQLGYGKYQRRIQAAQTDQTHILGIEFAGDKQATKILLREACLPTPLGEVIYYFDELEDAIDRVGGFPIVIKPLDGNHGRGITLNINSWEDAENAYDLAKEESKAGGILVERFYRGQDYRVLVINGKVEAVAERVPAHVIGDGHSTIEELVEDINRHPHRGNGHENILTRIEIDGHTDDVLAQQGYVLDSILEEDEICYLKATANLSTGGIAIDRTDEIHPETVWMAERAAKIVGLDIAGIDITCTDISRPLKEVDGVIIEVNAAPGLRMHLQPSQGKSRDVTSPILEMLYPPGSAYRIPIIAITGTNGKTTTTRLIAHIFKQTKKVIGYTTTDGTYIGEYLLDSGDNTGCQSAQIILNDPTVEVAVLETARGGILRSGLGFDRSDVGVVLNVAADHLGLEDINTLEEMAQVKSVVAEATDENGYAVLNADDPLVANMAKWVKGKVAYFSMNPENPIIQEHLRKGGIAAIYDGGFLTFCNGQDTIQVEQMVNVPSTLRGLVSFMISNVLAASLAAYVQGVSVENISTGLRTFQVSLDQTPGRMNLIELGKFHVLIDYAHNPAGYQAIGEFIRQWSEGERIGVIGGPGNRRDQDLKELGRLATQMFDWVIIKEDDDTRDRPRGEAAGLIREGICQEKPQFKYEEIWDETEAIQTALAEASEGSLVVIFPESVKRAIALLK
ncbi:MAG: cyanophycin synthetase [Limnoraphis robusta]